MELSVDNKIDNIVEGIRNATLVAKQQERKQYYKKKENPNKRGPKPRLSDEEKEERHKELLDYHKQYYQVHKEELKKKSYTNYKINLEKLRELKIKENPDFKPRNRKREVIDYYIALTSSHSGENTSESEDENTSENNA